MVAPSNTDRLAAALGYLARGWSVIPAEARGKKPLIAWRSFQSQCASSGDVERWFERWPDANVSIVTGQLSRLVVLDIDPRHGGTESLRVLERKFRPLPVTVEAVTGGGGRHLYFRHPGGRVPNRVGLCPGIDLRGDGGCVVAPPSMHASGQPYVWRAGRTPDDIPLAAWPRWLGASAAGTLRPPQSPRRRRIAPA